MKKIVHGAVAAAAGLSFCTSTAMALETKPTLTLDLAKKMAAACEAKAKQEKWLMNIAVVDDGANLSVFRANGRRLQRPARLRPQRQRELNLHKNRSPLNSRIRQPASSENSKNIRFPFPRGKGLGVRFLASSTLPASFAFRSPEQNMFHVKHLRF